MSLKFNSFQFQHLAYSIVVLIYLNAEYLKDWQHFGCSVYEIIGMWSFLDVVILLGNLKVETVRFLNDTYVTITP